jgi:hypothetical protein
METLGELVVEIARAAQHPVLCCTCGRPVVILRTQQGKSCLQGLSPDKLMPMSGAHSALQVTVGKRVCRFRPNMVARRHLKTGV